MIRLLSIVVAMIQILLAIRFLSVLRSTVRGQKIELAPEVDVDIATSVIVPVLNEAGRIESCLGSLTGQDTGVTEIVVVDGGSTDGTPEIVQRYADCDPRVLLVQADPPPVGWNNKAWNLQTGLQSLAASSEWVVTVDADVVVAPCGISSAVQFALTNEILFLSIATAQNAAPAGVSLIHPSLLSTLVYRFGIPGHVARTLDQVQANGQTAVYRRTALERTGGFTIARDSICEDVTLARHLFLSGYDVGFFEGSDIAETRMYASGLECLRNWPRSLSLRDRFAPRAGLSGLMNLVFLQVIPLMSLFLPVNSANLSPLYTSTNRALFAMRIGVMIGTRRAYSSAHWLYWLSPVADPITLVAYAWNLLKRSHSWRGRQLVSEEP